MTSRLSGEQARVPAPAGRGGLDQPLLSLQLPSPLDAEAAATRRKFQRGSFLSRAPASQGKISDA